MKYKKEKYKQLKINGKLSDINKQIVKSNFILY